MPPSSTLLERREWLDSLDYVLAAGGATRQSSACFASLAQHATA